MIIGSCQVGSNRVDWEYDSVFIHPDDKRCVVSSVVLFVPSTNSNDNVSYHMQFPSIQNSLDVACILQAHRIEFVMNGRRRRPRCTIVDRPLVQTALDKGELPHVPPSRWQLHQFALKRCMDVLFWRSSVHFFSAGPHRLSSLCFYNVKEHPSVRGHVALTIDDSPCRFPNRGNSRLSDVLSVLDEYKAFATFMVVGSFLNSQEHEGDLVKVLQNGHELGNHCMMDRRYDMDSPSEFESAVDECNRRIYAIQRAAGVPEQVRFFRAPHGKYTKSMEAVLTKRNLVNVMCDTYASCPIVEDGVYIGNLLSQRAQDGSIILLHMPEVGFREWCLVALQELLKGLKRRNLSVVTVGRLQSLANKRRA